MIKSEVIQRIRDIGVIPVVRASSGEEAIQIVEAIKAGGVSIVEITMTVPGAVEVIEQLVKGFGDETIVGAGTVLDPETAKACIAVGAEFIVSPALNLETIKFCRDQGIAVMPGALTPTEVVTAWNAGADFVKVFPCGAVGGAAYIKSLKAPLPQLELVPTGGVSLQTAASFIEAGAAAIGVGADLVAVNAIRAGQPEKITEAARAYIEAVRNARSAH
ncbi:MAG TPA: bifunctional 4-hydroxy-2-oxoglutarate aldolase/2-dehydro-3-deoxy-phosphogluconate aldolase [Pyrinomonadaceae bacterium]|jgi:2-dehydro-3-deoxyphosphogluconate aldolase/(4S)-4-hydroxy-2-oxoglutarate aldolase|nr:bifunctional 4-hydroxy-2-oxoglutarate aldolase/2-dehydro-3-deoxy-phosphogluconate aldolase [Pyrinomonadaceae bacterium]